MNKKARLILSLIPFLIVLPILFSGLISNSPYQYRYLQDQYRYGYQYPEMHDALIAPVDVGAPDFVDPPPTLQFFSDTTHTNTTATLTAIATDFLNNAGIRWIRIYEDGREWGYKDCGGQTVCTFVKVKVETQPANHTYYATTMDLGNHLVQSENITIWFEGINLPPIINDFVPQDLTPQINENETLHFEVWAHDPNNDPLNYTWKLDGQQVSTISSWDYRPDFNSSGFHDVHVVVSDGRGGVAVQTWNVTVINVLFNSTCFLNFNPQSPITYGTLLNASCYCTNPEAPARLWRDGLNVDAENGVFILLGAATYNYTCNVTQTQNYMNATNSSLYTINRANHTIRLALNGNESNLTVPINTTTNATGWLTINQGAAAATLYRNSQVVATGSPATEIAILPSGLYNYTYYYPQSQNYTAQSITRWLNVTGKINSTCNLTFVPPSPITYDMQPFIASCSCTNPEAQAELWRDNVNVTNENNLPVTLAANPFGYRYICNVTETQNYTSASTNATYIIDRGQTILTLTALPSWNVTYPTQTNVSCAANNGEVMLSLTRNGLNVSNPDVNVLSAGLYYYNCSAAQTQNWTAASVSNSLNVSKAASLVNLTLNGIDGNITIGVGESVNATGWLIIPSLSLPPINNSPIESIGEGEIGVDNVPVPQPQLYEIELYMDGLWVAIGNRTVSYVTNFSTPGLYNFTARYPGTQNYSQSNETHWVLVTADTIAPVVALIFPPNGSTTGENITVMYNVTDNIDLLLDCDIYSNTSGNWTVDGSRQIANATNGNWSYVNLNNGVYIWNVECRDDANNRAFAPANWTFVVNVTGDIIPPDIWNVSANPQFINQSQLTTLEAFARDNVAVDTVLAQVTYPDNTSANYTMQPGMIAEQYLYNFNDTFQIGNHSVRIFANDTSNNWNITEGTWFVVQTIPGAGNTTTIITQPADNSIFNLSQVFVTSANVTAVGGDVIGCNATITFSNNTVLNTSQPVNVLGNILNGTTVVTQWNVTAAAVGNSNINVTTTCLQGGSSFDTVYNITVNITGDLEPPVIIFVPPTPSNGSTVNVNWVYVNASITDNVAVDTAILEWNGTNFTMAGAEPIYYLNVTGLADGLYIFRAYANDTSNNWNVSETRYVTVNVSGPPNQPPVVNLTSPLNNTLFHNQQSINFSYIATDDNDLSFLCTIFLDNVANQSQITQNNTSTNFTIGGIPKGTHSWRVECIDSGGLTGVSETWYFTIGLHDVGIVLNYTNSVNGIRITTMNGTDVMADPANLSQNETYFIRYRVNNNGYPEINPEQVNMTVWLVNSTGRYLISSYLQSISQFHLGNVTFNPSAFAPGQYNITVNATIVGYTDINPSDNERNRTINIIQVGDFIPPWYLNITVAPPSPQVYSPTQVYWFNITWQDNVAVAQVWFEFNGVNYTPTCVPGLPVNDTLCSYSTGLAVGNHSYRWFARDTSNNYNQTPVMQYVVTQENITGFLHLALNGLESNLTVTYPAVTNATGWSDLNAPSIIYNLYRNNSLVDSGNPASDIRTLGAGVYNYVYNTTGNQNYSAGSTPIRVLTVNQGTTILTLNATPSWNVTVGTQTNVSCAANNGEVLMNLYRNNSLVASGYNLISNVATLPIGNYIYVCNTTGSQNWTAASASNILIVSDLLPGDIRLWLNGTEGNLTVTYANESLKFNASTLYGNVTIRRNGTLIAGPAPNYVETFNNLAAGFYNFTAYSTGNSTHQPASVTYFLLINKANSSLTLYLNGTNSNITITEGESVNHTAILNVPTTGTLYLLRNGTQFATGASPLTSITVYNLPNYYNITGVYNGSQNYSSSQATHFITVLEAVHDISVDSIQLLKEVNGVNKTANNSNSYLYDIIFVKSNVSNVGNKNETNINVTLEDNNIVRAWQLINLNVGQTREVTFSWNATTDNWHTLKVKSLPVPGETNLANNERSQDLRIWKVCDVIDCTIFMPLTQYDNYTLGTPFLVRAKLQNLWAAQSFYDLKIELQVSSGLSIIAPWPAIQWHNLAPGEFKYSNWNVTSTTTGNKTLTTWAGNREYSDIKYVLITP